MLVLLPLASFILTFLFLVNTFENEDWRRLFLASVLLFSTYLTLASELLSLFQGITQIGLSLVWLLPILVFTVWSFRKRRNGRYILLPSWKFPRQPGDLILFTGIFVILIITVIVALTAPPHTWDVLNYHLPRVAQWAQNQSLRPFPSGIDVQNSMPPLTEMMILHTYVLANGDRFANMIQWLAMLSSVIVVSLIAQQLGAGKTGQLLAALTAAAIPMGIAQSSSSMTDYMGALFVLAAASEILAMANGRPGNSSVLMVSTAAGLALLAKPTTAAYLIPLAVFAAVILFIRTKPLAFLRAGLISIILVLVLNTGQLVRNYFLYGNPLNNPERLSSHANGLNTPEGWASNIIRNVALHTGTPFGTASKLIYDGIVGIHDWFGLDVNDPRTTFIPGFYWVLLRTNEDLTGNFFHAGLVLAAFLVLLMFRKRFNNLAVIYALITTLSFILVSSMFKWQPFSARFHLAFFLMFSPLIAYVASRILPRFAQVMLGVFLLVAAYPWLFSLDSRPIIPTNRSVAPSILTATREELYFVNGGYIENPYRTLVQTANENDCSEIGLMLFGGEAEYPVWVLAGAPKEDVYFEWIVSGPSSKYETPGFQPCAVICQGCEGDEWQEVRGLERLYNDGYFQMFFPHGTHIP
ncbi:MAG: hypothetical protein EHM41_06415 [Chloroflexi bacterium]|nr:MAG: hypothetical protein EHM41_06415 [Chloroflexota bacterium]